MNKDKFFLTSLIISLFVSFLGGGIVKIVYQIYNLPTRVNTSAIDVFLALGMSCMFMSGIIYFFGLWFKKEWRDYPFFYIIRSFLAFVFILLFFLMFVLILYQQVEKILVLF